MRRMPAPTTARPAAVPARETQGSLMFTLSVSIYSTTCLFQALV